MDAQRRLIVRTTAGLLAGGLIVAMPSTAFAAGRFGGLRGSVVTSPTTPGSTTPTTTAATTTTVAGGGSGEGSSSSASAPNCRTDFSMWQQTVEQDLTNRVNQLATLTDRVNSAQYLTSADRSTLQGLLAAETSGIEALVSKVPTDTTCVALRADAHSMVYNYRVYLVMTPQTDLTIVADTETAIASNFEGLEPSLQAAIASMPAGEPQTNAQAAYTDLVSQVSGAQSAVDGLSVTLLAQTPAGCPGNRPVFAGAKATETTARADLKAAENDVKQIIHDLSVAGVASPIKGSGSKGSTTTTG